MAQAGIHALLGAAVRKVISKREWLGLGIVLGSLFPDLDNYAVAVATLARLDTHGLHRTFTHSLFTILAAAGLFAAIAVSLRQPRWANLGVGLGIGIGLHMALDVLVWFNGVELLWPLGGWVNLWESIKPPVWFAKLMEPAEFLFFGAYFWWLTGTAQAKQTDVEFLGKLRWWTAAMAALLIVFTPLAYLMEKGFLIAYGAAYLLSLTAAFFITIRLRRTIAV